MKRLVILVVVGAALAACNGSSALEGTGVHVMVVCPGYVKTGFQQNVIGGAPPGDMQRARRFAITPEECARAIRRGVERDARTVVTPSSASGETRAAGSARTVAPCAMFPTVCGSPAWCARPAIWTTPCSGFRRTMAPNRRIR